ncbi:alpha-glucosidase, partial [bacterium]
MTQSITPGSLLRFWQGGRDLELIFERAHLRISALGNNTARLRLGPGGKFAARRSWDVVAPDDDFGTPLLALREDGESIRFEMGAFRVIYQRGGGLYFERAGQRFCVLNELPGWDEEGAVAARLATDPAEHFYGFGERTGLLEKSGSRMTCWATDPGHMHGPDVDSMYIAIPFAMALRPGLAWGLFFHNTFRSEFDLTQPGELALRADGGELDCYVMCAATPAELVSAFSALVGRTPMPPLWALGYHQSRWSYSSAQEVRDLVEGFRRRGIPLDAVHLDIDYMDGYRDFTWNRQNFPDPARLTRDLKAQGVRVVAITDAGVKVDPAYEVYTSGQAQDAFVRNAQGEEAHAYVWPDESVWPDFSRPAVRAWWANCQRKLLADGIAGIWNDMNEPVTFNRPFSEGGGGTGTLPLDALQGPKDERTTHAELHNLYGLGMAQACYEGLERDLNG